MALKLFLSDLAGRRRRLLKADVKDAYTKGKRRDRPKTYMDMPSTCQAYDEDGTPFVICLEDLCMWGESEAGYEWEQELHEFLLSLGWRQCIGVPAMYYFNAPDSDCRLVKIVDDLAFSDSADDAGIAMKTIKALKERYGEVSHDEWATSLAGYKITQSEDRSTVVVSQPQKVIDAVVHHLPHLLETPASTEPTAEKLMHGTKLDEALKELKLPEGPPPKSLSKEQHQFQSVVGCLKYFERGSFPRLTKNVHSLTRVMSNPPPNGLACAKGVLAYAYAHKDEGLTFGRRDHPPNREHHDGKIDIAIKDGAPNELEITADASNDHPREVFSVLMTRMGASVLHLTKNIGVQVANTQEAECIATVRASEYGLYARVVERALGVASDGATLIITDNLPNQRVAQNVDSAQRSRYFLVRYACLHQRIADGDFLCLFTHDPNNPSDFLTKTGINIEKVKDSVAYAIGACNASHSRGDYADETAECIKMLRSDLRSDRGGCSIPPQRGR